MEGNARFRFCFNEPLRKGTKRAPEEAGIREKVRKKIAQERREHSGA
jgi:hypothetical protein